MEPTVDHPPRGRGSTVRRAAAVVVLLIAGGALFLSGFALGALRATTPGTPVDDRTAFAPFWDTYRSIQRNYALDPVSARTLAEGAIRGMIAALGDPFSQYLSPDDFKRSLEGLSGRFEGIGATMGAKKSDETDCAPLSSDCRLTVLGLVDGAPAQRAGLRVGDRIAAIDGTALAGISVDDATKRIRGAKGTTVRLTVIRGGAAAFDLPIVRDVVAEPEVSTRPLANGSVGYVKLAGFSDQSALDLAAAVKADVAAGQTRLILDLRGDPGGYVQAAQRVASQFLADGVVFYQRGADGVDVPTDALPGGAATDPRIRLAVLVDGNSASASEIVAGALQAHGRAKLIGAKTYGKGTIQTWQQLADDSGGFRLTTAKWLTPDGHWIHGVGLLPDVPVEIPANLAPGADPVLDRALELLAGSGAARPGALDRPGGLARAA